MNEEIARYRAARKQEKILAGLVRDVPGFVIVRSPLTEIVNAVNDIQRGAIEAYQVDRLFDGGEFSGPAIARTEATAIRDALLAHGWTGQDFDTELANRTTAKWAYDFCGPGLDACMREEMS